MFHIHKATLALFLIVYLLPKAHAQVSIKSLTSTYTQNFNTLKTTTSSTLPTGWLLYESGTNGNTTYGADAGTSLTGNTYSYGTGTNSDRAYGMLRSGSLIPTIGVSFKNTTGKTLYALTIRYTGEQWRCGATGRTDQLDFQYSLNAGSLASGSWTDVNELDFIAPYTIATGALNGNLSGNRSQKQATLNVTIPNNAVFWLRWSDFDASGSDDGLSIDDFSLAVSANDATPPTVSTFTPLDNSTNIPLAGTFSIQFSEPVQKGTGSISLRSLSNTALVSSWTIADAGVTVNGNQVTLTYTGLAYAKDYYLELPSGSFKDLAGNNFAGINGSTTWNFKTLGNLDTLKVVNWNIEWFGGSLGPANDSLQEVNVKKVLTNINADVYALGEIVSVARLQNIVAQMPGYAYVVGTDFCSNSTTVSGCASAQKLGFIYKTAVVGFQHAYPMLRYNAGSNAAYNWSSGRFPYLMQANVTQNGVTLPVEFIMIHAKANTPDEIESYNRRKNGALELRDSLLVQHATQNWLVLGDYNDDLDRTITTQMAPDTTTSFQSFKAESTFIPVTLPLSQARVASTVSYPDFIDHVTISNEMHQFYVPGSATALKNDVEAWIPNYGTTTSDHYPVLTKYILTAPNSLWVKKEDPLTPRDVPTKGLELQVTGRRGNIDIRLTNDQRSPTRISLYDLNGRMIRSTHMESTKGTILVSLHGIEIPNGIYLLSATTAGKKTVKKFYYSE